MNTTCACKRKFVLDAKLLSYVSMDGTIHTKTSCTSRDGGDIPPIVYTIATATDKKASKNDQSKLDISLIPYVALREEAVAFMVGQKKYGRYNYCKGHEASQLVAAAQRHLLAWFNGEDYDPTDGQHHLGSVRACCAMILRQSELGTLVDNRYKQEAPNANSQK